MDEKKDLENQLFRNEYDLILSELNKNKILIDEFYDLHKSTKQYKEAIPILINCFPIIKTNHMKEVIIRFLSVPWARNTNAIDLMLKEFYNPEIDRSIRWAIGNAIDVLASDKNYDEIEKIIKNDDFGSSRQMVVSCLSRMKKNKNKAILLAIESLPKESLTGHAINVLRKMNAYEAAPYIEKYLTHENSFYRKEAKKAIKKFSK